MSSLEDRLRTELPQLAEALIGAAEPAAPESSLTADVATAETSAAGSSFAADVAAKETSAAGSSFTADVAVAETSASGSSLTAEVWASDTPTFDLSNSPLRTRRRWPLVAAAAVVLSVVPLGIVLREPSERAGVGVEVGARAAPSSFGTWAVLADAPIDPRPYAVSAWTGEVALFFAGADLSRGFAYTDGAAYNPDTDSWEQLSELSWGHPGLTGYFFDGELYALAKGAASKFDPATRIWSELAPVEGMFLAATVATDSAIWGLGPAALNPTGQPDLAIVRYEPESDALSYGPVYEGTDEQAPIVQGVAQLESTVLWSGDEIIVWRGPHGGIAFDPEAETWRVIDGPVAPAGVVRDSIAVATNDGFAVLAEVETAEGFTTSVAVREGEAWRWLRTDVAIDNFESASVASVPGWLLVFSADQAPVAIHLGSGAWFRDNDGPLGGVQAPNTVWTGDRLIVWGGYRSDIDSPEGASWIPPTD